MSESSERPRAYLIAICAVAAMFCFGATASSALAAGTIQGNVVEEGLGGPALEGICVNAQPVGSGEETGSLTDENGDYSIPGLDPGNYTVQFVTCAEGGTRGSHVTEYFDDSPTFSGAQTVTVADGQIFNANAALAVAGALSGTVTDQDGEPIEGICVRTDPDDGEGAATTNAAGSYEIRGLAPGSYTVRFFGCDSGANYLPQWFDGAAEVEAADPVIVVAEETLTGIDAQMVRGATISGTLTSEETDDNLEGACAFAYSGNGRGAPVASAATVDGDYEIVALKGGTYWIRFAGCGGNYASEYYEEARSLEEATPVTVANQGSATGIDGALGPGGTIAGSVEDLMGVPASSVCVDARNADTGTVAARVTTDFENGSYSLDGLAAGSYVVRFEDCGSANRYGFQYYAGASSRATATPVDVVAGETEAGIDAVMAPPGSIEGTVTDDDPDEPLAIAGVCVSAYEPSDGTARDLASVTETDADGDYSLEGLASGNYVIEFDPGCADLDYATEFYDNKTSITSADLVAVTAPGATTGIDAEVSPQATGPRVRILTGPPAAIRNRRPTFTFSVRNAGVGAEVFCSLTKDGDTEVPTACSAPGTPSQPWIHQPATPLADGHYEFKVSATDLVGSAVATRSFTIDNVAPALTIDTAAVPRSTETQPSFTFTAESGSTVRCSIHAPGDLSLAPCVGGTGTHTPATPLPDGHYEFAVRATDAAGNATTVTSPFEVDTTAPAMTLTEAPTRYVQERQPQFEFTVDDVDAILTCALFEGAVEIDPAATCSSSSGYTPPTELDDGEYTFVLEGADDLGNEGTEQWTFTVDNVAPAIEIDEAPAARINNPQPSFTFESEANATYECSLAPSGTEDFGPCAGALTHQPDDPLADGDYTFAVRATDRAGNLSTVATASFELDTAGPDLQITQDPGPLTNDPRPAFAFEAGPDADTLECRISDGTGPTEDCSSLGYQPATALLDSDYVFEVIATDDLGNVSSREHDFTVDTEAPAVSVTSGPSGVTTDATPSFTFAPESGSTVECSIERAGTQGFGACTTGSRFDQTQGLAVGDWTFTVRATDAAGNQATSARDFTVINAPTPPPPADPPADPNPPVDPQPPVTPPDTTAPSVQITSGPGKTKDTTPKFTFSSNDPAASFACKVDSGAERACSSSFTSAKLKPGKHKLAVVAIDAAGNRSQPATQAFTIKKKKRK